MAHIETWYRCPTCTKLHDTQKEAIIAEDTGCAVKGNVIDLYVGRDKEWAVNWGRRLRKVVVL